MFSVQVNAQEFLNLKGVVFQSNEKSYDGVRTKVNHYYFFSFTDKVLLHQVLTKENDFSEAQFYKLENITKYHSKADEKSVFKATAKSGVTGKVYNYIITIYDDGTGNILCDEVKFFGKLYEIKTFVQ